MEKPEFCRREHLEYLDELRESGVTNMFGARPYLCGEFEFSDMPLTKQEAGQVLSYWMETFSERHGK